MGLNKKGLMVAGGIVAVTLTVVVISVMCSGCAALAPGGIAEQAGVTKHIASGTPQVTKEARDTAKVIAATAATAVAGPAAGVTAGAIVEAGSYALNALLVAIYGYRRVRDRKKKLV